MSDTREELEKTGLKQPESIWIPVEDDEKPQEDTFVLAYHPDWTPEVTQYRNGEFEKIGASPVTPTHWMHIPVVPAEKEMEI